MADSDLTVDGLTAANGVGHVTLRWSLGGASCLGYLAYDATEIWVALTDDRDAASKVGEVAGNQFVHEGLADEADRYYWARARDVSGNLGAWSGEAGVVGKSTTAPIDDKLTAFEEWIAEIEANVGGVWAGGLFRMAVSIAPDGWDVSIAAMARAEVDGVEYEAGWWIFLNGTGESGIALRGNTIYITDDDGDVVASPFLVSGGVVRVQQLEVYGDVIVHGEIINEHAVAYAFSRQEIYRAAGAIDVSNGQGEVTIASLSITGGSNTGSRVKIMAKANLRAMFDGNPNWGSFEGRLYCDGSLISTVMARPDDEGQEGVIVDFEVDNAPGGVSKAWALKVEYVFGPGPGLNIEAYARFLSAERADK